MDTSTTPDLTTGPDSATATQHGPDIQLDLPADFRWGVATASYQIEGAVAEGRPHAVHLGHLLPRARGDRQR